MSKLIEKRNELDAKRKALRAIFDEAGADLDMDKVTSITGTTSEKASEIKRRNDELTAISRECEELAAVEEAAKTLKADDDKTGKGLPLPGSGGNGGQEVVVKSLGQLFTESDAYRTFNRVDNRSKPAEIEMAEQQMDAIFGKAWYRGESKTLLTTTGFAPEAMRTGLILPGQLRTPVVGDLIPDGRTGQNAIKYMEETTTTNAAAAVAEGGTKPESALAFTEKTSPVRKIATVLPVTDELFEDESAMRSYVEARLRTFLALAEEDQLLNGSGAGVNIRGLLNTSGIQTRAKGAEPTPDTIFMAMTDVLTGSLGLRADGIILNPIDWQDIRLLRTADGIYIWGSPADAGPERIWGLDVTLSVAIAQNTGLVGAFNTATQKFRRNEVAFAVSDQHADFFITNQLMLRVEERLALVVYRPTGLVKVTGI